MGSLSEWRSVGDDRLTFKIPEGSGQGVQWAELLFTKSHTTGTREHPMVLVQGELKIDRSTSLHSKKQTFRTCNQMRFFIFIYGKEFQTHSPPYSFLWSGENVSGLRLLVIRDAGA